MTKYHAGPSGSRLPNPLSPAEQGQDHAGKARAAAQVHQVRRVRRYVGSELAAIQDVAPPGIGERGRSDQVDRLLPALQQFEIDAQPRQCFT